jgi:hypothetical protein
MQMRVPADISKWGTRLRIGTCSWKYDSWKGLVYDEERDYRAYDYLGDYALHFNTWCRPRNYTSTPTPNRTCKFPSIRLSRQL